MQDGSARTVAFPAFDMVIVDETKVQDLTEGFEPKSDIVAPALVARRLRPPANIVSRSHNWQSNKWQEFDAAIARIRSVMRNGMRLLPPGDRRPLTFRELRAMAATDDEWRLLGRLLWALKLKPDPAIGKVTGASFSGSWLRSGTGMPVS